MYFVGKSWDFFIIGLGLKDGIMFKKSIGRSLHAAKFCVGLRVNVRNRIATNCGILSLNLTVL